MPSYGVSRLLLPDDNISDGERESPRGKRVASQPRHLRFMLAASVSTTARGRGIKFDSLQSG